MPTAESYIQEAWRLVCRLFPEGKLAVRCEGVAEVRAWKREVVQLQKELRLVKKRMLVERREIASQYSTRRIMIGKTFAAGFMGGLIGRKRMGGLNAARRADMRVEQLNATQPFDDAAQRLEAIDLQLDELKNAMERKLLELSSGESR